jgi:ferric-chelate reductase (NADPH)
MDKSQRAAGRLERALFGLITKTSAVVESQTLDAQFRLITLRGESLRGVAWVPGQKVQMVLGGWVQRTYTPLSWDAVDGVTTLLAYLHGAGPATEWASALAEGDACSVFGPRGSLDLNALTRPALLFGDETSFALAHALRHTPAGAGQVQLLFEVTSKPAAKALLERVGIEGAQLVERKPDDAHLSEVEALAADWLRSHPHPSCVLSGKASSIQRLSKRLRALGVGRSQIQTKAYWAVGKSGLD